MKSRSIWEETAGEYIPRRAFAGDVEADVVVIGGGITGLTAALLLSDAGKKVIVLEARQVGLGTTGNSTGNLYSTVDDQLAKLKGKWGADVMKQVVRSRKSAVDLIENTVRRFNIDCDFQRVNFNYFAETVDEKIKEFVAHEFDAFREAGIDAEVTSGSTLPFKVTTLLSAKDQAQFHPLKYARGLTQGISARCEIYENSQVIDFDDKEGIVKTASGKIRARHIIMATHVPVGVYMVQTFLGPYREHGVAAEVRPGSCPPGIFWSIEEPKHSIRSYTSAGKEYVMVIGDKYKTGKGENTNEYVAGLEAYLRKRFDVLSVTHTWGGQQYRPADGLPYIGKHGERTYFLTGFATDGLVYGTLGAAIVSDLINGVKNEWADVYKLSRFTPLKSFKEFFKENADVLGQYIKDVPWNKDADSLKEIRNDEGKVIEMDGEKMAVYRDSQGYAHVCSAVCTHMKCIVNWNPAERTWDCPCHGSRFTYNGHVIEGPAITPLAQFDKKE